MSFHYPEHSALKNLSALPLHVKQWLTAALHASVFTVNLLLSYSRRNECGYQRLVSHEVEMKKAANKGSDKIILHAASPTTLASELLFNPNVPSRVDAKELDFGLI